MDTPGTTHLMTAPEAAARIGMTTAGLSRMAERGALLPVASTLQGYRLFSRDDVERIRAARETLKMADRRKSVPVP
jgi:DNA-binding transcriptional MerR regulator